jgi:uncharacterized membrane protein
MRPWVRLLLVVSLALNLLIAGLIGGAVVMRGKWQEHHRARLEMMGGPMTRALDHADRRAMRRGMYESFGNRQAMHEEMRAGMEGLIADLQAVPFDADAIAQYMAAHRAHLSARLERGQTLLLERLSAMDNEERAAYAERLQNTMNHGWRERHEHE